MSGNRALRIVSGTVGLAGAGLLYARWYVDKECKKLERSETHDDATALKQYMMFRYFRLHGDTVLNVLDHDARHISRVQENLLMTLMRQHDSAAFARQLGVHLASNSESFRERVPLTGYADYVPFVQRTLDGEPGLLLSPRAPPTMFVASAGTTGPPKWLPMTKQQQEFYTMYSTGFTYGRMFAWRPDTFSLRRSCRLLFPGSAGTSSAGIPMGADAAVSTGSAKERLPVYSTPEAAFAVEHAPSLLYLHLLFALRDRDLSSIQAEYAPALLAMLALLDDPDTRAALLSDLEGGTISQDLTMALPVRLELEAGLRPSRARAAELRAALAAHDARGRITDSFRASRTGRAAEKTSASTSARASPSSEDASTAAGAASDSAAPASAPSSAPSSGALVTDIWPRLDCVVAGSAGPLAPSRAALRRRYLPSPARVPLLDPVYQSAEAILGGNVAPFDEGSPPPAQQQSWFQLACPAELQQELLPRRAAVPSSAGKPGEDPARPLEAGAGGDAPPAPSEVALPEDTSFLLLPQSAFFEFIPVDAAPAPGSPPVEASAPPAGGPTTRLLHELEAGRRYEVVVTTKSGLWRYRTGDVVQVVGLQQGALPVVRLLYRKQDSLALPAARHGQSAGSQAAGEPERGAADGSPAGPDGVSSGAQPEAEAEAAEEVVLTTADVETALRSCEAVWSGTASADGASDSLGDGSSTGSVAGWFASGAQTRGSATEPVDPLFSLGNFAMALVEAGGGALAARVAVEAWAEDCEGEAALPAGAAAALDRQLCRASAAYAEARRQGRLEEVRLTGLPGSASDELWLRRANANSELAALLKPQMRLSADAQAAAPSEAGASERA